MKTVHIGGHTFDVPSDYTGGWCVHCDAARKIADEVDPPGRCQSCHKLLVFWVPPGDSQINVRQKKPKVTVRATCHPKPVTSVEPPPRYILPAGTNPFDAMRAAVDNA